MTAIEARLRVLGSQIDKLRKEARQARAQERMASDAASSAAPSRGAIVKGAAVRQPPVFISLHNGLLVETEDKWYSFKLGGPFLIDGGASSQPFLGRSGTANINQAWLTVDGRRRSIGNIDSSMNSRIHHPSAPSAEFVTHISYSRLPGSSFPALMRNFRFR